MAHRITQQLFDEALRSAQQPEPGGASVGEPAATARFAAHSCSLCDHEATEFYTNQCGHHYHQLCYEILAQDTTVCCVKGCGQPLHRRRIIEDPPFRSLEPPQYLSDAHSTETWRERVQREKETAHNRPVREHETDPRRLRSELTAAMPELSCSGIIVHPELQTSDLNTFMKSFIDAAMAIWGVTLDTQNYPQTSTVRALSARGATSVWDNMRQTKKTMPGSTFLLEQQSCTFQQELQATIQELPRGKAVFCLFGRPGSLSHPGGSALTLFYRDKNTGQLLLIITTDQPHPTFGHTRIWRAETEQGLVDHLRTLIDLSQATDTLLITPWQQKAQQNLEQWQIAMPVHDLAPIATLHNPYQIRPSVANVLGLSDQPAYVPDAMAALTTDYPKTHSIYEFMAYRNSNLEAHQYFADDFRMIEAPPSTADDSRKPATIRRRKQAEDVRSKSLEKLLTLAESGVIVNLEMNALAETLHTARETAFMTFQYGQYYLVFADGKQLPLLATQDRAAMQRYLMFLMDTIQTNCIRYRCYHQSQ